MASYLFNPPGRLDRDRALQTDESPWPAGRQIPRVVGLCVLRVGGVWQTVETPRSEDWDAADRRYLGGHVHTVSQAEADDLVAGGYGLYLTLIT